MMLASTAIPMLRRQIRCFSSTGKIYSKGSGLFGALGLDNNLHDEAHFKSLPSLNSHEHITKVSAGWGHSAALTEDGYVYTWGRCFDFANLLRLHRIGKVSGWLARMASSSSGHAIFGGEQFGVQPIPVRIQGLDDIQDVACSAGLTVLLGKQGQVWAYGGNVWNQCSIQTGKVTHVYEPLEVDIPSCQKIEVGLQHVLALTSTGDVVAWGKCDKGQLGIGKTSEMSLLPQQISLLNPKGNHVRATSISAGFNHSAALTSDGAVYVWGKQMSDIEKKERIGGVLMCEDQMLPRRLQLPSPALEICSSNFVLVIRTQDNRLWAMGLGEYDRNINPVPVPVTTETPLDASEKPSYAPFILSDGASMRKGYHRVFVHSAKASSEKPEERLGMYEVVLHEGEAFVLPWKGLDLLPAELSTQDRPMELLDYSAGWKHELLVLK